jgi:hypothetical protein
MAGIERKFDSLRLNRLETDRLTLALLVSLALHLFVWGGYEADKLWERLYPHAKIKAVPQVQPAVRNSDPQLTFVTVDQPATEAPEKAKYYSDKNSQAANQQSDRDTDIPKLNGKQTDMMKLEDVPRPQISKAQSPSEMQLAKNETRPESIQPGDWSRAKPQDSPEQKNNPEPLRPRTLNEARAQQSHHLPGQQMKQEGGVRRHLEVSSVDTIATPRGAYDAMLVDQVSQSWFNLLYQTEYASDSKGKVMLAFRLHSDGRITNINLIEDTADEKMGGIWALVCESAVGNAAPFAPWPSDMLHAEGTNYRDVTFTFFY